MPSTNNYVISYHTLRQLIGIFAVVGVITDPLFPSRTLNNIIN